MAVNFAARICELEILPHLVFFALKGSEMSSELIVLPHEKNEGYMASTISGRKIKRDLREH